MIGIMNRESGVTFCSCDYFLTRVTLLTLADRLIVGGVQVADVRKGVSTGLRVRARALPAWDIHLECRVAVVPVEADLAVYASGPISAVNTFARLQSK